MTDTFTLLSQSSLALSAAGPGTASEQFSNKLLGVDDKTGALTSRATTTSWVCTVLLPHISVAV